MKFIYKINSGYDGFHPGRLSERLGSGRELRLGWTKYLDVVDKGDEVWIYFLGPHRFVPGVYAKSRILSVDYDREEVRVRVNRFREGTPLTDPPTSARIAAIVATRYRQVFVFPDDWDNVAECDALASASSCRGRKCDWCPFWKSLPEIVPGDLRRPRRLPDGVAGFAAGYWAVPSRCFLPGYAIAQNVHRNTELLGAFKTGNENLAFPIALGLNEVLHDGDLVGDYDCIIPIPLSPDKGDAGEIHRTLLIARELGRLLSIPVRQYLSLKSPISKRRMLSHGYTYVDFENAYEERLVVADAVADIETVLLIDDVCTHGGTFKMASQALRRVNPKLEIVAAAGMQMVVKASVRRDDRIRAEP